MTYGRARRGGRKSTMSYAGWLLAELSLVLMIVMVGSEAPRAATQPAPTTAPTPKPTPSPTRSVKSGLAQKPLDIDASMSKGPASAARSLHGQIKQKRIRPAFILLWGIGTADTGPKQSRAVAARLRRELAKTFDADPLIRAYYHPPTKWKLGRVYAEVFYFNE